MEFTIKNLQKSITDIMRSVGYRPAYFQPGPASAEGSGVAREFSVIRPMGSKDYPRFHLYITNQGRDFTFKLHLDQKKPSYEGQTGHSGEYEGEIVRDEAERIKASLGQ